MAIRRVHRDDSTEVAAAQTMVRQIVFEYDDVEPLWSHIVLPGYAVTNRGHLRQYGCTRC
jgi:hypothetical protein